MEDMNALALVFVGMVACFAAFVAGLFRALSAGVESRAAVCVGGAWAVVAAGIGVALMGGGVLLAAVAVGWLIAVRAMVHADPDRARLLAVGFAVVVLLALGPG